MKQYTYEEIAKDFSLWQEYVDPMGFDTEKAFNEKSIDEKIAFMTSCFGPDTNENYQSND